MLKKNRKDDTLWKPSAMMCVFAFFPIFICCTYAYAALSSSLYISGDAVFIPNKQICNDDNADYLSCIIMEDNGGQDYIDSKEAPKFNESVTTNEGVYSISDDYTNLTGAKSYYYRGAVTNNNLIFAERQWKVIRTEGNGNVKLIYNGECPGNECEINADGASTQLTGSYSWNNYANDNKYVGYMYGGINDEASHSYIDATSNETNSLIKAALDNWFHDNILIQGNDVVSKIADTVYCNDRSIENGGGYGNFDTIYNAYARVVSNKKPSLRCKNKNDRFTKDISTLEGNGVLDYEVGLISIDEVSMAGGVFGTSNDSYYLYTNQSYWSMSPSNSDNLNIMGMIVDNAGAINQNMINVGNGLRPVITLNYDVKILKGNGSSSNPYVIALDEYGDGDLLFTDDILRKGYVHVDNGATVEIMEQTINEPTILSITGRPATGWDTFERDNMIRWYMDFDLTNYSKLSFYAKQGAPHGCMGVYVDNTRVLYYSFYDYGWHGVTDWKYFEVDLSSYTGVHTISLFGGYIDWSGSADSNTRYSNILLVRSE